MANTAQQFWNFFHELRHIDLDLPRVDIESLEGDYECLTLCWDTRASSLYIIFDATQKDGLIQLLSHSEDWVYPRLCMIEYTEGSLPEKVLEILEKVRLQKESDMRAFYK